MDKKKIDLIFLYIMSMKHIKTFEDFKPITINSVKPFKFKKGLLKNAVYLQKGIKSDRKRLEKEKDPHKRTKLNNDKNHKINKLRDISFKTIKQAQYLKDNPVKENYSDEDEDKQNLIQVLESPDFKSEDIVNYIGMDEGDYKIDVERYGYGYEPEYYDDKLKLFMKDKELDDILGKDDGTINFILTLNNHYNNYEYYVDDSDLDFIGSYLPEETIKKIKKFAKLFNYNLEIDEDGIENGEISKLFNYLGLSDKLKDFKTEISNENTRAVERLARHLIKSLPFILSFEFAKDKFNIELEFKYKDIIDYMKENNLKVYSIKELLENISEFKEFSNEIEYSSDKYEYMEDYKDLIREVNNVVENYTISPDDIFPKLIAVDNLKAFQDNFDKALFNYNYDVYINYNRIRLNLFNLAKFYKGKILQWFLTPEFELKIKERSEDEFEAYEQFIYKENAAKYNL